MEQIAVVIEQKIRPALQAHHGDIKLVEITTEGIVKVQLTGACATCPGAQQTMSDVIERVLVEACPEVKEVVAITAVSDDLINQALRILRQEKC